MKTEDKTRILLKRRLPSISGKVVLKERKAANQAQPFCGSLTPVGRLTISHACPMATNRL